MTDISINLTATEILALISAVQLAATIADADLIQKDAVEAAKKIQESLPKDSTIYNHLKVGWQVLGSK